MYFTQIEWKTNQNSITQKRTKRISDYLKDDNFIDLIERMIRMENKRYKNGDYNREGIDDED